MLLNPGFLDLNDKKLSAMINNIDITADNFVASKTKNSRFSGIQG